MFEILSLFVVFVRFSLSFAIVRFSISVIRLCICKFINFSHLLFLFITVYLSPVFVNFGLFATTVSEMHLVPTVFINQSIYHLYF